MFYELQASCYVHISPKHFSRSNNLVEEVNTNLLIQHANKVTHIILDIFLFVFKYKHIFIQQIIGPNHGLCITVSEINEIGDARIVKSDGGCYVKVIYKLILLKPYKNEVIECVVDQSDPSGIICTLGFFSQIFVPLDYLPLPLTKYDSNCNSFVHVTKSGAHLPIGSSETVRVKVLSVEFREQDEQKVKSANANTIDISVNVNTNINSSSMENKNNNVSNVKVESGGAVNINTGDSELIALRLKQCPMVILASMNGPGLGPVDWW